MLHLGTQETEETADYYDKCLNAIRRVLADDADDAVDHHSIARVGKYVLLPIDNYYHVIGAMGSASTTLKDTAKILGAKLRYLIRFQTGSSTPSIQFGLYPAPPRLEAYHLQRKRLIMRIGPYDWASQNMYESILAKF